VLIGVLNTLNLDGSINGGDGSTNSLLSEIGRLMTPIFAPMGIHQDNWPVTVGLVTGILAKEVVVGTLNSLYTQIGHLAAASVGHFHFWAGIREALWSIPVNFAQIGSALLHPLLASSPLQSFNREVYGVMYQHFDGRIGAFSYLLFVLLYFPCVSTTAAMLRELNQRWAVFSIFWMSAVAYGTAVVFYQAATLAQHPLLSLSWILGILLTLGLVIATIRMLAMGALRAKSFGKNPPENLVGDLR